jgi:hypothetical protein
MIGRLNSTGTVSIAGAKLALELPNNYRPSLGQSFEIVRAASIAGVFSSVEGMPIAGVTDRRLAVVYVDSTTDLVRVIAARPGDANLDQTVGFADLLVVAQNYEAPGVRTWATGDFDGNGNANFSDLLTLAQFYSSPQTLQSDWATARALVPEPTMLSLLLASGLLMARRR